MGKIRDVIREIAEVRERRRIGNAMAELQLRLSSLERAFELHGRTDTELAKYFPVALIACLEGYFRMAIKDLVDSGEPYFSNAEKLAGSVKLDFSLLKAIHGKSVTFGEIVSHGVPLSRLEHVESVFSSLLGSKFLTQLRTVSDRWEHEVKGEPVSPILTSPDEIFSDVSRTFELRHIICHEIASGYEVDLAEIEKCLESCVAFLRAADELISETLHPNAPLTQTDMNLVAGESLAIVQKEIAIALEELRARLDEKEIRALNRSQETWEAASEAWADFVAGERVGGGSIWPVIYADAARSSAQRRLEELKSYRRLSDDFDGVL